MASGSDDLVQKEIKGGLLEAPVTGGVSRRQF